MSQINQLSKDAVNAWCDAFLRNMVLDTKDKETVKSVANILLSSERTRGPLIVNEADLRSEDDRLAIIGIKLCQRLELPVTASGLAMLILGCHDFKQVLMNVAIAKRQFELVKEITAPLADAQYMMLLFGEGTYTKKFYNYMWKLQSTPDGNFLALAVASDFQQTPQPVV